MADWTHTLRVYRRHLSNPKPTQSTRPRWDELKEALECALIAATELEALRKRCEAVEARLESVRQDVLEFYDAIPDLPITAETADAATDVLTKFCIDFQPIMEAAAQEPSHG